MTTLSSKDGTVDSTSSTTGAILVSGGVGVGKNLNVGQDFKVVGIATFSNEIDINAAVDILRGLNVSGITSVQSLSIGSTQVISSARELQNISSLDSTTTATIEAAIKVAPNTFTDLKITGISTFIGIATFGGGIAVQAWVSTFDAAVDINAGLDVDGQADLDEVVIAGVTTHNEDVYFYELMFVNNCKIYPIIHYEFYENFYTLLFLYDVVSLIKYLIYDYKYHSITALHYNQVIPYLFQSVYHWF